MAELAFLLSIFFGGCFFGAVSMWLRLSHERGLMLDVIEAAVKIQRASRSLQVCEMRRLIEMEDQIAGMER